MKKINIKIRILKEIIGSDYTIMKRRLSIYNLTNDTDYVLSDYGLKEYTDSDIEETDFYFYGTRMDEKFTNKQFFTYIGRWKRSTYWLDNYLGECECSQKPLFESNTWETIHDSEGSMIAYNHWSNERIQMKIENRLINHFMRNNEHYDSTEATLICKTYLIEKFGDTFNKTV